MKEDYKSIHDINVAKVLAMTDQDVAKEYARIREASLAFVTRPKDSIWQERKMDYKTMCYMNAIWLRIHKLNLE
jgi:hypothetical protein